MEEYRVSDVESELGLSQEAMVRMALLLGSDYTEGVPGIGIVNALEVVRGSRWQKWGAKHGGCWSSGVWACMLVGLAPAWLQVVGWLERCCCWGAGLGWPLVMAHGEVC